MPDEPCGLGGRPIVALHGRKSEVFKTSTGRRIAPAIVESHLRQIPYVEHAVVFGANRLPDLVWRWRSSEAFDGSGQAGIAFFFTRTSQAHFNFLFPAACFTSEGTARILSNKGD